MEKLNLNIPTISLDTRYYLVKTCNGKYYSSYLNEHQISYYPYHVKDDIKHDKMGAELDAFCNFRKDDIVLIPNYRNKIVSIGMIKKPYLIRDDMIIHTVIWLKEITTDKIQHLFKYINRKKIIVSLDDMKEEIERHLYPYFEKNNVYHIILAVKQQNQILCKSIYGLYHMILNEIKNQDLKIKMSVKSPGLIEFITGSIDVLIIIIKVFRLLRLISENKVIDKESQLVKTYYDYEVGELHLEIPELDK